MKIEDFGCFECKGAFEDSDYIIAIKTKPLFGFIFSLSEWQNQGGE